MYLSAVCERVVYFSKLVQALLSHNSRQGLAVIFGGEANHIIVFDENSFTRLLPISSRKIQTG